MSLIGPSLYGQADAVGVSGLVPERVGVSTLSPGAICEAGECLDKLGTEVNAGGNSSINSLFITGFLRLIGPLYYNSKTGTLTQILTLCCSFDTKEVFRPFETNVKK